MTCDLNTIRELNTRSGNLFHEGAFIQSVALYESLIGLLETEQVQISEEEQADIYNGYGLSLKRSGNLCRASQTYLKANELSHFQSPVFLNNLAVCLLELAEYQASEGYFQQALEIVAGQGSNPYDVAFYRANVGTLRIHQGRFDEALDCLLFSYDVFCGPYPTNDYAHTLFRLAHVAYLMGYYADALKVAESSFRAMAACRSLTHPRTAEIRLLYAKILLEVKSPLQAQAQIKSVLSVLKSRMDAHCPMLGRSFLVLAECESATAFSTSKTVVYLKKAYRCFRHTYPNPDNPDMADYYMQKANFLVRSCQYKKAIISLKKALRICQRLNLNTHPLLAECYYRLGQCYAKLDELQAARKMYIRSLRIFKSTHRKHPRLPDLLEAIAALYSTRLVAKLCRRYTAVITVEKPSLLRETKVQQVFQKPVIAPDSSEKPDPQEVQILIVATSDMKPVVVRLYDKILSMITFHESELPRLCCECYVEGDVQCSTRSFQEFMRSSSESFYSKHLICLIGDDYGKPGLLPHDILEVYPWMTNYRDRSEWELLTRQYLNGHVAGMLFYREARVPKNDIHNPYWKIKSLVNDVQTECAPDTIRVRKIMSNECPDVDWIMFRLNAAILKTIHCFRNQNSVSHNPS